MLHNCRKITLGRKFQPVGSCSAGRDGNFRFPTKKEKKSGKRGERERENTKVHPAVVRTERVPSELKRGRGGGESRGINWMLEGSKPIIKMN